MNTQNSCKTQNLFPTQNLWRDALRAKQPAREELVRVASSIQYGGLAYFSTAAWQLVSEVESYFSSHENGNLDRLELLEGRLEEA